jgi:PadR family transcriptional regulator PadR
MLRSQLLKGTVPFLILSVLDEGELYGYEISQRISDRTSRSFAPSEGSLYPALHRLEREGALVAQWRSGERGPRRRYYRLTPSGRRMLDQARDEWDAFSRLIADVTVRAAG